MKTLYKGIDSHFKNKWEDFTVKVQSLASVYPGTRCSGSSCALPASRCWGHFWEWLLTDEKTTVVNKEWSTSPVTANRGVPSQRGLGDGTDGGLQTCNPEPSLAWHCAELAQTLGLWPCGRTERSPRQCKPARCLVTEEGSGQLGLPAPTADCKLTHQPVEPRAHAACPGGGKAAAPPSSLSWSPHSLCPDYSYYPLPGGPLGWGHLLKSVDPAQRTLKPPRVHSPLHPLLHCCAALQAWKVRWVQQGAGRSCRADSRVPEEGGPKVLQPSAFHPCVLGLRGPKSTQRALAAAGPGREKQGRGGGPGPTFPSPPEVLGAHDRNDSCALKEGLGVGENTLQHPKERRQGVPGARMALVP